MFERCPGRRCQNWFLFQSQARISLSIGLLLLDFPARREKNEETKKKRRKGEGAQQGTPFEGYHL